MHNDRLMALSLARLSVKGHAHCKDEVMPDHCPHSVYRRYEQA